MQLLSVDDDDPKECLEKPRVVKDMGMLPDQSQSVGTWGAPGQDLLKGDDSRLLFPPLAAEAAVSGLRCLSLSPLRSPCSPVWLILPLFTHL